LRSLLQLLARGIVSGGDAAEAGKLLLGTLDASGLTFVDEGAPDECHRAEGVPKRWLATAARLRDQDPARSAVLEAPVGAIWLYGRDASRARPRSPYYDALLTHGFADAAVITLASPARGRIVATFYRKRGARPFDEDDVLLLTLLHPHLASALGTQRALAALREPPNAVLDDVLRAARTYAFVSYPSRTVEWPAGARRAWTDRFGAIGERDWTGIEQAVLRVAGRYVSGRVRAPTFLLTTGLRVDLASIPARPSETLRVVAIFTEDREEPAPSPRSPAEHLLSKRQREVARLAARGFSASEIAKRLGMQETTARHHLRTVYRRLGIHRRAELGALLGG
jgi:DNA-binding CsgD family transcriptional regulator